MNFIEIVKTKPLREIKQIVETKAVDLDPKCSKYLDYKALNTALECGRKDVAEYFLSINCRAHNPDQRPSDTPLHNAVKLGDINLVGTILEKAPFSLINSDDNTALHLAFMYKHNHIVDLLLRLFVTTSFYRNQRNKEGLSHLHIACTQENKEAIEGLIKDEKSIEETVHWDSLCYAGYNALHFAAEFRSLSAIQVITSSTNWHCCDKPNKAEKTPLQLMHEHHEKTLIMSSLLSRKKFSQFHLVCTQQSPKNLSKFLENGANVNDDISFYSGFCPKDTPLHCAVKSRQVENVELILKHSPDLSLKNKDDMTALHLAMYNYGIDRIVNVLYRATEEKDQDISDKNGLNYFHISCSQNDLETAEKLLLDRGVNVNAQVLYDKQIFSHYTALHFTVRSNNIEMAKWLIENQADVNLGKDGVDGTPLHLAFSLGHVDVIELLLVNGADPKIVRSADDNTMFHLLVLGCTNQVESPFQNTHPLLAYIEKLFELGVNINAQNKTGDSPLHLACRRIYCGFTCLKHLLKFGANINLLNDNGNTPFDLYLSEDINHDLAQRGDYTILFHHVQKLIALGIEMKPENEECCKTLMSDDYKKKLSCYTIDFQNEELERMQQNRKDEICFLKKNVKIVDNVSVYDFLRFRIKRAADFAKCRSLLNFFDNKNLEERCPIYGSFIKLRFREVMNYLEQKDVNYIDGASNTQNRVKRPRDSRE